VDYAIVQRHHPQEDRQRWSARMGRRRCIWDILTADNEFLLYDRHCGAQQVLASSHSVEENGRPDWRRQAWTFISNRRVYRALDKDGRDPGTPILCDACFTGGPYPIPLPDQQDKRDGNTALWGNIIESAPPA